MAQIRAQSSIGIPPGDPVLRSRDEQLDIAKAVVGKLSHDFNNFLAPQLGYVSLLKEDLPPDSPALQYAEMIEGAARKAESVIQTVLLAVRPQRRFAPEQFDFAALLDRVVAEWTEELPPGHGIQVKKRTEPSLVWADAQQWETAIGHLLANARFALATGGTLSIDFGPETLSGEEMQRLGISQPHVHRFVVRDSGFGMSPDVARRAFEPFFTSRAQRQGSGLGLTVVHSVARLHGGQVELISAPDQGTAITVWIAAPVIIRQRANLLSTDSPGLSRVMFLSADPILSDVLRSWLLQLNCDPIFVASERELPAAFKWNAEGLRLIVYDLPHAVTSAGDILTAMEASGTRVPLVALAHHSLEECQAPFEVVQIQKPFGRREFEEAIQRFVPPRL